MHQAHPRRTRRFTVDEVLLMANIGIFDEGEPVELINGELLVMSPIGPPHTFVERNIRARLERLFPGLVCAGAPIILADDSMPEPDVSVLRADSPEFGARHPRGDELILAVEVARTSLKRDHDKTTIYADAGVPVYWIVDVEGRRVMVHSDLHDGVYRLTQVLGEDQHLTLPEAGDRWLIADLLPAR